MLKLRALVDFSLTLRDTRNNTFKAIASVYATNVMGQEEVDGYTARCIVDSSTA